MFTMDQIKPDMEVIDTRGVRVGIVDHVQEDGIGLTHAGFADDLHHFVSLTAVTKIDGNTVIVEPGHATTIEAVAGAISYARRNSATIGTRGAIFGTSTVSGGSGIRY